MHVEVFDVRIAAQKPEQLVDNRFDVKLFRGEQWKSWTTRPQIIARLSAKDRQGAGTSAIAARLTLFQDKPEKIVVLPHAKSYRGRGFRKMFLARVFAGQTGSNVTLVNVAPVRFRAAPCARSTFAIAVASGCNWIMSWLMYPATSAGCDSFSVSFARISSAYASALAFGSFDFRNGCKLAALLTSQRKSGCRSIRNHRRFAMLAVKRTSGSAAILRIQCFAGPHQKMSGRYASACRFGGSRWRGRKPATRGQV